MNQSHINFDVDVLFSQIPVLVDFSAEWCGPCRAIAPSIERIANEFEGRAKVVTVDIDADPESAAKYGIMSIPALVVFKNGVPVDRIVGAVPQKEIADLLTRYI